MALTAKMDLALNLAYTAVKDLGTATHQITQDRGLTFTNGTGANKADVCFDDKRTLADLASEELDLQDGSLTDSLGTALTMDIMRAIYIKNTSSDATLLIGGATATQLAIFSTPATDILKLGPGGEFFYTAPSATGIDTTTNAHLKLADDGSGAAGLDYEIIIVGED